MLENTTVPELELIPSSGEQYKNSVGLLRKSQPQSPIGADIYLSLVISQKTAFVIVAAETLFSII
jgi:hypothetical protein